MQNIETEKMNNTKLVKIIPNENNSKWKKETQELTYKHKLDTESSSKMQYWNESNKKKIAKKHEQI